MTGLEERRQEPRISSHGEPARTLAGRCLFAGPTAEVPDELYVEVLDGYAERRREVLRVGPHSRVGTNTYFGRFPASWWQRWTSAREVRFDAAVRGAGRVLLRASDTNGVPRTLAVHDAGTGTVGLGATLDRFLDGGGLWIEIVTDDADLTVEHARWTVPAPAVTRSVSVAICTYNRADDCLATLTALAADPAAVAVLREVIVVDQGSDPVESRPGFPAVRTSFAGSLRYLRQPNLGGSGGFTRGLVEVVSGGGGTPTDTLFMDDDVRCEPEVVIRLAAFAAHTAHPTVVGAQMLNLLHPTQVLAGAEYAVLDELSNGHVSAGAVGESDVTAYFPDGTKNAQDRRVDAGYTGWWSCLIPGEVVEAIGYPLPLFFQWDDVEYSLRARAHGFPVVTLPGAGLWHADFPWKDWDDWHRYFNLRNAMITAALHGPFRTRTIVGTLSGLLQRYLVAMNYGLAVALVRAVEDFLRGPEVLDDGGTEAGARIRAERSRYPETVAHRIDEAPDLGATEMSIVRCGPEPSRTAAVLAKRIAQQALGRTPHHGGLIGAGEAHWWHVGLFDRVAVTDAGQGGVRIRRRDPEALRRIAAEGARALWALARRGNAAADQWRAAMPRLTSRENWARLHRTDG